MTTRLRLSIVIPAYNEASFIATLLARIAAVDLEGVGVEPEVIVVDDGSRDDTAAIAETCPGVRVIRQTPNRGKGRAVRTGIAASTGDYVLIQDADLEYEPADYLVLIAALRESAADIVYGSRYLRAGRWPGQSWAAYLGGRSLSLAAWYYTGARLTDTVTALKLFPRTFLASVTLETTGFELDHELTARALAAGLRIVEAPIRYTPRSKADGKKIGARDWLRAIRTFRRYASPPPAAMHGPMSGK